MTNDPNRRLALALRTAANRAESRLVGYIRNLADRAEAGEFGDFSSPHATPKMMLVELCRRYNLEHIAELVMDGEFDD